MEDVEYEIKYWQSTVVFYVIEASPPFSVLEEFIQRICVDCSIDKIVMMKNGMMLERYNSIETSDSILHMVSFTLIRSPSLSGYGLLILRKTRNIMFLFGCNFLNWT